MSTPTRSADPTPTGRTENADPQSSVVTWGAVTVVDGGEHVVCGECGGLFRSLGTHLAAGHGLSAAAYRRRHDLPAGVSLAAPATRHRHHITTTRVAPTTRAVTADTGVGAVVVGP